MELKETKHSYYCSENNYRANGNENHGRREYDTWEEFCEEWLGKDKSIDDDYNHCFRYDILQKRHRETDELVEGYRLWLFFILQRKGNYVPVLIKTITEKDMIDIETFLKERWEYLIGQWSEFSTKEII